MDLIDDRTVLLIQTLCCHTDAKTWDSWIRHNAHGQTMLSEYDDNE